MALTVLLDSVILIDHFNGVARAGAYLASAAGHAAISVITRAEVLAGFDDPALAAQVLDRFPTLGLNRESADLAAALRRRYRWRLPDAFQAALAQQHGLRLATRNVRDFPAQRFDFVLVPYLL
jgi:predicted nucleic acid-binding protein